MQQSCDGQVYERLNEGIRYKKNENECAQSKFPEQYEWINIEGRNTFNEGVGAGTLNV